MRFASLALLSALIAACSHAPTQSAHDNKLLFPGENHFTDIRQITFSGTNAEAYWSFDGKRLSFQHKAFEGEPACDQIYVMRRDGSRLKTITREARTTCAYFLPGNERVLYSSTMSGGKECPPDPDKSRGYVWPIFDTYQIYSANAEDGSDIRPVEPGAPRAYNAEATVCKDGSIIFTSDRDGDLELYRGQLDSFGTMTDVTRLTFTPGYDGGAFFSQDCKQIVWRASRPRPGKELDEYQALLKQHLVRPGKLEIWVANADGSHARQVTRVGAASFAPFFTPDASRILFASNPRDPRGRKFNIYSIAVNGTGLERVTYSDTFDSFPMFSPDGKRVAFSSNRNASRPHETNVFVAEWKERPVLAPTIDSEHAADRLAAWSRALAGKGPETGLQLSKYLAAKGLKLLSGSDGEFPIIAQAGKCKTPGALVTASLTSPVSAAGALQSAELFLAAKSPACVTYAFTADTGTDSALLSKLASMKIRPTIWFPVSNISSMEQNSVQLQIPEGREARLMKQLKSEVEAACTELTLACTFTNSAAEGGTTPLFRVSSGENSNAPLNATGAVQIAELVANAIIRIASK